MPLPIVTVRRHSGTQVEVMRAYLIKTPEGSHWALPEASAHALDATVATAYRLNPTLLVRLPDTGQGAPSYLYSEVLDAPL
jgi:hypothetical protein